MSVNIEELKLDIEATHKAWGRKPITIGVDKFGDDVSVDDVKMVRNS